MEFQNMYENVTYRYVNNERENALYIYIYILGPFKPRTK